MSAKCQITDPLWVIKASSAKAGQNSAGILNVKVRVGLLESYIPPSYYLVFHTGVILCKTLNDSLPCHLLQIPNISVYCSSMYQESFSRLMT